VKPSSPAVLVQRLRDEEDDEPQFKPLEWSLIRRLFGYARPVRAKLNVLIALTLIRSVQLPALAWMIGLTISGPIARHDAAALPAYLAVFGLLALLTDGLFHFRQRYAQEIGEVVVGALRHEIFVHVQRMPMAFFHRIKLGRILGRVTSDVESLRTGIQDVFFVSTVQIGQMVFSAAVMLWCDPVMFLVVALMAPVLWSLNRHFRGRLSRDSRAAQESFSRVTATLAESVNGMRVTQGFVRQETNAGLFRSLLNDHSRYNIALARTSAILMPLLELNSQFFIAILLMLGGWRTFHGFMEVGELIQFFFLANLFFAPIQIIGNQYNQALIAMAGTERVFRLLDAKPDWEDDPAARDLPDPRPAGGAAARGVRVELDRVNFGYDPAQPVLHDVSFVAPAGSTVALVGHTGSGKSSIINLVTKFYLPTAGRVLVDDADLARITSGSLHRQMGIVPQQNYLFGGTVLANIRQSRPSATDDEVRAVTEQLGCRDLIEGLPQGFLTEVGERGAALSAGQRQLVCFARALLADPRLLILDEATSAIDALTEARLQQALARLLAGRTSLVVAHRLSTIRHADLVLVLDRGRIVERGTHAELLSLRGHYAALHRQFVQMDDRI
jgi:ABC-type multidrug transport system fused ATPase/permease subunit